MGHPAGQLAHGLHLLRLGQLGAHLFAFLLGPFAFSHVLGRGHDADRLALIVSHKCGGEADDNPRAVPFQAGQLYAGKAFAAHYAAAELIELVALVLGHDGQGLAHDILGRPTEHPFG